MVGESKQKFRAFIAFASASVRHMSSLQVNPICLFASFLTKLALLNIQSLFIFADIQVYKSTFYL